MVFEHEHEGEYGSQVVGDPLDREKDWRGCVPETLRGCVRRSKPPPE
jgi:hypothetical protein